MTFDPEKAAKARIGWWKEHHSKNYKEVTRLLSLEIEILHGIEHSAATKIVLPLIEAAKEHDLAEKRGISVNNAQQHWDKALEFMTQHFKMLNGAIEEKNQALKKQEAMVRAMEEYREDPADPEKIGRLQNMGLDPFKIPKEGEEIIERGNF